MDPPAGKPDPDLSTGRKPASTRFFDLGHGYDFAAKDHTALAGAGIGLDYAIGQNLTASLTGAVALHDAALTDAGDCLFNASIRIAY